MPVAFEGPPDETSGLAMFLEQQRAAILRKLDGLSQEQAVSRLGPLIEELARHAGQADIIRESIDGATGG